MAISCAHGKIFLFLAGIRARLMNVQCMYVVALYNTCTLQCKKNKMQPLRNLENKFLAFVHIQCMYHREENAVHRVKRS